MAADAFIGLHRLHLIPCTESSGVQLDLTASIARHELNTLQDLVSRLESRRILVVHDVVARTPAHRTFRELLRDGIDKGEAEAIAWARHHATGASFISNDHKARKVADQQGPEAMDVFDFLIRLVREEALRRSAVMGALAVWDDQRQSFCRPSDFTRLDETWRKRGGP